MPSRIASVASRRVVERPRAWATSTSRWFASRTRLQTRSSARCSAKRRKNSLMLSASTSPMRAKAAVARSTACRAISRSARGRWRSLPPTAARLSPGAKRAARSASTETTWSPFTSSCMPATSLSKGAGPVMRRKFSPGLGLVKSGVARPGDRRPEERRSELAVLAQEREGTAPGLAGRGRVGAHVEVRVVAPAMTHEGLGGQGALADAGTRRHRVEQLREPALFEALLPRILDQQRLHVPGDEHVLDVALRQEPHQERPGTGPIQVLRGRGGVPAGTVLIVVAEIDVPAGLMAPVGPQPASALSADVPDVQGRGARVIRLDPFDGPPDRVDGLLGAPG